MFEDWARQETEKKKKGAYCRCADGELCGENSQDTEEDIGMEMREFKARYFSAGAREMVSVLLHASSRYSSRRARLQGTTDIRHKIRTSSRPSIFNHSQFP